MPFTCRVIAAAYAEAGKFDQAISTQTVYIFPIPARLLSVFQLSVTPAENFLHLPYQRLFLANGDGCGSLQTVAAV